PRHDRALHFVAGDRDAVLLADAREHQAKAHAAFRNLAIFLLEFVFGLALVRGGLAFALQFGFDLLPDRVEFRLDHGRRQFERMQLVERIENAPFHVQAAGTREIGLQLFANAVLECTEIVDTELFRELAIDGDRIGLANLLHADVERRVFSGERGIRVARWERHVELAALAGLRAGQLILETGNELARTQIEAEVVGLAAGEFQSVDLANKVDDDKIALLGRRAFFTRRK